MSATQDQSVKRPPLPPVPPPQPDRELITYLERPRRKSSRQS